MGNGGVPINCRQTGMRHSPRLPWASLVAAAAGIWIAATGTWLALITEGAIAAVYAVYWDRTRIRCYSGGIDNGADDTANLHIHAHANRVTEHGTAAGENIVEFAWYIRLTRRDGSTTRLLYIIPGPAVHEFGSATTVRERQAVAARVARKVVVDPPAA